MEGADCPGRHSGGGGKIGVIMAKGVITSKMGVIRE